LKKKSKYSKGEINKLIDKIFHPMYKKNESFRLLDGLAHGLVEQDPKMSLKKFVRYNFPDLIEKLLKKK
jgi:hypothetical protein